MKKTDFHTHVFTKAYLDYLSKRDEVPRLTRDGEKLVFLRGLGDTSTLSPAFYDIDLRLKDMDATGVDLAVISPVNPWLDFCQPEDAARVSVQINDEMANLVKGSHGRFVGLGILPMKDPESAVDELRRSVKDLGLRGAIVGVNIDGKPLSSKEYWKVLQQAAKLGVPILAHPNTTHWGDQFNEYHFGSTLGYLVDTTLNIAKLVFDGTLERIPELKIVLAHQGASLPYIVGRMDAAYNAFADCRANLSKPPSHYLKQMFADVISYNPSSLRFGLEFFGQGHLLFGSDYPFQLGKGRDAPASVSKTVEESGLDAATKEKVYHENAATILGI